MLDVNIVLKINSDQTGRPINHYVWIFVMSMTSFVSIRNVSSWPTCRSRTRGEAEFRLSANCLLASNYGQSILSFPISGFVRAHSFDVSFLFENGNYIVHRCLFEITGYHRLRFCDIRFVPYLDKRPSLGIVKSFITHFITHLVDEVERNGDSDVVVWEVKRPFTVEGLVSVLVQDFLID